MRFGDEGGWHEWPAGAGRMTADGTGEVVVFLVGTRVNSWRAVRSWLPVCRVMPRMIKGAGR
ncbi:monooxygenase family protein [Streptomyces lydicus]|uniref:monooxygenase family protein n=1 Tax=Streptomyces lydicus TaxID=47763 RepID=UPI0037150CEB